MGLPVQGLAEQVDVSGQMTVSKSGLRLNRTSNTFDSVLTLTNSFMPVSAPARLVVSDLGDPSVTLANANGTTADGAPYIDLKIGGIWALDMTLNTTLKFSNPKKVSFSFKTTIFATPKPLACSSTTGIPILKQTIPVSGATGDKIKIFGKGFTACSQVYLAGKVIATTQILSDHELEITLPFDVNRLKQLIPMGAGTYLLKVDNSVSKGFTITDLPENPTATGQLMNEFVTTSFQGLAQSHAEFQASIPDLLNQANKDPSLQRLLHALDELGTLLNNQGQAIALQALSNLDATSLNTLERVLYSQQIRIDTSQPAMDLSQLKSVSLSNKTAPSSATNLDGDTWIENRKAYYDSILGLSSEKAEIFGKIMVGCIFTAPDPISKQVCTAMSAATAFVLLNKEITVTLDPRYGIIKSIQLDIENFSGSTNKNSDCGALDDPNKVAETALTGKRIDRVCQSGLLRRLEKINLHLNNANNSLDIPTNEAKKIAGATLYVTHRLDLAQILLAALGMASDLSGVTVPQTVLPVLEKALEKTSSLITDKFYNVISILLDRYLNSTSDFLESSQYETKAISVKNIDSNVSDFLSFIPAVFSKNCEFPFGGTKYFPDQFYLKTQADGLFSVPDVFPSKDYGEMPNIGGCDFRIKKDFRLPSEEVISSKINFHLKNYPRLNLTKQSAGSVHYGFKTISGATDCLEDTCTEFLDLGKDLVKSQYFWLSAYTQDAQDGSQPSYVTWMRNGNTECDTADCKFNLNFNVNNDPPLNIDVSFTSNYDAEFTEVLNENIDGSLYYQCPPSKTGEITDIGAYFVSGFPGIVYGEPKFSIKNLLFDPEKIYFQIPWDERLSNSAVYDFSGEYINNDPNSITATANAQVPLVVHQLSGPGCDGVININETSDIYLKIEGRFNPDGSFVGFMDMKASTVWNVNSGQKQVATHDGKYAVLAKPRLISATK